MWPGEVGVVERNCKYNRLASPGIVFLCCPFEAVKTRYGLDEQRSSTMPACTTVE